MSVSSYGNGICSTGNIIVKKVASLKMCCLLDKNIKRVTNINVDYVGITCPDKFVVGYGMDFVEHYSTLPFIGVLKSEAYVI